MSELTDRLGFSRVEEIVEFLLKHMSMETRGKLMAEMPQHYALLYPGVSEETIIVAVRGQMWQLRKKPGHPHRDRAVNTDRPQGNQRHAGS